MGTTTNIVMPLTITHTKIYGRGAADVLKQNEINAKFIDGNLNIILSKTQNLVIVSVGDETKFYLESIVPDTSDTD